MTTHRLPNNCQCEQCGKGFRIVPAAKKRGQGKFCSADCQQSHQTSKTRFWEKVNKAEGGCWLWTGPMSKSGYGTIALQGKRYFAHRFSWAMANGEITGSLFVLHKCDTPLCVNPTHLFLGDQAANMRDMNAKGRHGSSSEKNKGGLNPAAKLTEKEVSEIRAAYAPGKRNKRFLAHQFSVSPTTVYDIVTGKTWTHLL